MTPEFETWNIIEYVSGANFNIYILSHLVLWKDRLKGEVSFGDNGQIKQITVLGMLNSSYLTMYSCLFFVSRYV